MSGIENRRNERYPLESQPEGRVFIRAGSLRYLVKHIRDISSSGMSVSLEQNFSSIIDVTVEYLTANGKIDVFGKIIWCSPQASATSGEHGKVIYLLGIELLSPMMLFSVLQKHSSRIF